MSRIVDYAVVHTAAAYSVERKAVVYQQTGTIREYHKQHNGWSDIGYHWVIEKDGSLHPGRLEDMLGAHVGGFNEHTIGICVTGHGDFAPFLPAQMATLIRLLARICQERSLPASRCIGHREAPKFGAPPTAKTCPGLLVDMSEIRRLVGDRLAEEVA